MGGVAVIGLGGFAFAFLLLLFLLLGKLVGLDGKILDAAGVEALSKLPGKNELRASLLATMQAPLVKLLQQLNAPGQNFVYVLKAKEDKAEKAG